MTKARTFYGRRYKGLKLYRDRHGRDRCYYRPTGKELPNPDQVSFREFDRAYWEEATGEKKPPKPRPALSHDGTVEKAIAAYMASPAWEALSPATQVSRGSLLGGWSKLAGEFRLATMRRPNIEQGLENRKATPPTANNWLVAVRALFDWCISEKRYGITDNPTTGVKRLKVAATEGFTSWTEADVERFVARWPAGTMEYRALVVLLWSGQRRTDVVEFGWHKFEGEMIVFEQSKTGRKMKLPLSASLAAELPPRNVVGIKPLPFLLMTTGEPFSPAYFTQWFHAACLEAGLDLSPHGTRKLAAQRMYRSALRAGRTDALALTMAFTGHKTERQLRVYLGENFEQEEYAGELATYMR
jgi:integrase